jgi:metal-responsive CopG/Arc/MetJ family transcriptional regulator
MVRKDICVSLDLRILAKVEESKGLATRSAVINDALLRYYGIKNEHEQPVES